MIIGKYVFWAFVVAWYAYWLVRAYLQHREAVMRDRKRRRIVTRYWRFTY